MTGRLVLESGEGRPRVELLEVDPELELSLAELTADERARLARWLATDLELAADWARNRAAVRARAQAA